MLNVLVKIGVVGGDGWQVVAEGKVCAEHADLGGSLEVNDVEFELFDLFERLRWEKQRH